MTDRNKFRYQLDLFNEKYKKVIELSKGIAVIIIPKLEELTDKFFSHYLTDHPNENVLVYDSNDKEKACKMYLDGGALKKEYNVYKLGGIDGEKIRKDLGIKAMSILN